MKFCPYCGAELEGKERFCISCGKRLSSKGKRLYRFPEKGLLGGVCYGVAEFLEMDPTLVRVVTVIGSIAWFPMLFLYLFFWFLFPRHEEPF